jgi:hypothetical protein
VVGRGGVTGAGEESGDTSIMTIGEFVVGGVGEGVRRSIASLAVFENVRN